MSNLRTIILIEHPDKKLYVAQRDVNKKKYPGLFSLGVESAIQAGETRSDSMQRRLKEVGINHEARELFEFIFDRGNGGATQIVYHINHPHLIKLGREFQEHSWMDISRIDELLAENKLCPDTAIIYERFKKEFYDKV